MNTFLHEMVDGSMGVHLMKLPGVIRDRNCSSRHEASQWFWNELLVCLIVLPQAAATSISTKYIL
jgi:hypothetical protein